MANGTVDQAYLDYLLGQPQYTRPSYDEDQLKAQGSWMTQASKGGNLSTDLDYLMSAGLLDSGAYNPVTSLDPVDAPGYRMIQNWKGGSAYEQYLASQFEMGKTANEILADVQRIVADPGDDPTAIEIANSLPRYYATDQVTGQLTQTDQPDMRSVSDELRRYESTIMSDPQYSIGPDGQPVTATTEDSAARKAALDAGYVNTPGVGYDPYTFAPEGTKARDFGIAKDLAGATADYVNGVAQAPQITNDLYQQQQAYQRWMNRDGGPVIADVGGPDRQGNPDIPERGGIADDAARFFDSPGEHLGNFISRLPGRATQIPGAVDRQAENIAGALDSQFGNAIEDVGSGRRDLTLNGSYGSGNQWSIGVPDQFVGDANQAISAEAAAPAARGNMPGTSGYVADLLQAGGRPTGEYTRASLANHLMSQMDIAMRQQLEKAKAKAQAQRLAQRAARQQFDAAAGSNFAAGYQQQQRQALANQLLANGRSPFQDEVNRRNASIYGMGA